MTQQQAIKFFEERKVRTVWDDEQEKWYFSIVDVIGVPKTALLLWIKNSNQINNQYCLQMFI